MKNKRIIALLLGVIMTVSMIPVTVFADQTSTVVNNDGTQTITGQTAEVSGKSNGTYYNRYNWTVTYNPQTNTSTMTLVGQVKSGYNVSNMTRIAYNGDSNTPSYMYAYYNNGTEENHRQQLDKFTNGGSKYMSLKTTWQDYKTYTISDIHHDEEGNATVTITAKFRWWKSGYYANLNINQTITITPEKYEITYGADDNTRGTISPTASTVIGGATGPNVIATPEYGYAFVKWTCTDDTGYGGETVAAGEPIGTSSELSGYIPKAASAYTAHFAAINYNMKVTIDGVSVTSDSQYCRDSSISATETPAAYSPTTGDIPAETIMRPTVEVADYYEFAGWIADRAVTYNGAAVPAGTVISMDTQLPAGITVTDSTTFTALIYGTYQLTNTYKEIILPDGTLLPGVSESESGEISGTGKKVEFPNGYILTESAIGMGTDTESITLGYERSFTYNGATYMVNRQTIDELDINGDPIEVERTVASIEKNDVTTLIVFRDGIPYLRAPRGTELQFRIHTENLGPAEGICFVVDTLPTGLNYIEGTASPVTGDYFQRKVPDNNNGYVPGAPIAQPGLGWYLGKDVQGNITGFVPEDNETRLFAERVAYVKATTGTDHPTIFRYIDISEGNGNYVRYGERATTAVLKNTLIWDTAIPGYGSKDFTFTVEVG